jgi:hypothetical protein
MDEEFYLQLKYFFKKRGITQQQIADSLGVQQSFVGALLNGRKNITRNYASKFHELYGLSVAWLLTGEGEMLSSGAAGTVNNISIDASNNVKAGGGVSGTVSQAGGSSGNDSEGGACGRLIEQNQQLMDIVSDQQKQINQLLQLLSTKL